MDGISAIAQNEIKVSGYNDDNPVLYQNLVLNEAMINVNNFSFSLRPANNEGSLSAILSTKKELLGKETEIKLSNIDSSAGHTFKGIITEVNSSLASDGYYEFHVIGMGKFYKVHEIPESHSYYKKNIKDIIKATFKDASISGDVNNDALTKEQHYIVQYNQSCFDFAAAIAIRFGEWMYYDGNKLQFGKKPEGEGIKLKTANNEVSNLNIRAKAVASPKASIGTDIYKSEVINANLKEDEPSDGFLKASLKAGEIAEHPGGKTFVPAGFNKTFIDSFHKKMQEAVLASSVFITGNTRNTQLSVGVVIKIIDGENDSGGKYLITRVSHQSSSKSHYSNSFTAVPFDVPVPPYTNPLLFPKASPQPAIVTDNEDDKGLARVKVKFPWMTSDGEKTPWISVLAPHAGKDKGFRFIPEKDDEVLVAFIDGDVELPYVNGALYTEKNKAGIAEAGNNIKLIGSRTGRRFSIDDDKGIIKLEDKANNNSAVNFLEMVNKDAGPSVAIVSGKEGAACASIKMNTKKDCIEVFCQNGGKNVVQITFDGANKKIEIKSDGDIDITAEGKINLEGKKEINLKSQKITIAADNELSLKGTSKTSLSGTQIKVAADAKLEMKSSGQAALEGAMLDLKGSGIANLQGALVKIN